MTDRSPDKNDALVKRLREAAKPAVMHTTAIGGLMVQPPEMGQLLMPEQRGTFITETGGFEKLLTEAADALEKTHSSTALNTPHPAPNAAEPMVPNGEVREITLMSGVSNRTMCTAEAMGMFAPPADPEHQRLVEDAMRWRRYSMEQAKLSPHSATARHDPVGAYALPSTEEVERVMKDAARFRWLCDASGREWEALLPHQMCGRLSEAIDAEISRADDRSEK